MFSVHTDFECSNLRDRAFKCQTPTVEMRMTMQQDQIFKQNFFLIASSSLYNSAVLFGFGLYSFQLKRIGKVLNR